VDILSADGTQLSRELVARSKLYTHTRRELYTHRARIPTPRSPLQEGQESICKRHW